MDNISVKSKIDYVGRQRRKKILRRGIGALSVLTVVATGYTLMRPATAMENVAYCGIEEHAEHTKECYSYVPVCGYGEVTDQVGDRILICGMGDESEAVPVLVCGQEEFTHEHADACYETTRQLVCTEQEHVHGEGCYDEAGELICQLPEHTHGDGCYQESQVLVCNETGHTHDESCYALPEEAGHVHTEECYHTHTEECFDKGLICQLPIHEHTLQCYSNPSMVESQEHWEQSMSGVKLSGVWADDIVAIAESQLGYSESTVNYEVQADGATTKGYTRYGAWYGNPYGDWCAMFVSFCLNYSGIDQEHFVYAQSCTAWVRDLSKTGQYIEAETGYIPSKGDVIFFDYEKCGTSTHVGLVTEVNQEEKYLRTIEGNNGLSVRQLKYDLDSELILGYGILPENPDPLPVIVDENLEYACGKAAHTHVAECYDANGNLTCTVEEHVHSLSCIEERSEMSITATAEDGAEFTATGMLPQGARLIVTVLTEEETAFVGENIEDIPTNKKAFAYDIKILFNGLEFEPDDSIKISITGKHIAAEDKVEAYHLPDIDSANLEDVATTEVQTEKIEVTQGEDNLSFEANGFSVYYFTVDFTVDFYYEDKVYNIDGNGDGVALSTVMQQLEMERTIEEVENVTWEGEAEPYVTLSVISDDWWIAPVGEPFEVFGDLTLYYTDGTSEVITVGDKISGTKHLGENDVLDDETIADNTTVIIHGTVFVDGQLTYGKNVTFKLATEASGSYPAFKTDDKSKVALQFRGDKSRFYPDGRYSALTILGTDTMDFIIDGGARWTGDIDSTLGRGKTNYGYSHDYSLIYLGQHQISDNLFTSTNRDLSLTLNHVTLQNNCANKDYSAFTAQQGGGAIYINNRSGSVNISNTTIRNCYHVCNGGAIEIYDNCGYTSRVAINLTNVEIYGCDSGYSGNTEFAGVAGGTIKTTGKTKASMYLNGCSIHNNYSNVSGGGILWYVASTYGQLSVVNSQFYDNKTVGAGGAIHNTGILTIENSSFTGNKAKNGGAISHSTYGGGAGLASDKDATSLTLDAKTKIKNNTASSNGGAIYFEAKVGDVSGDATLSLIVNGAEISNNTANNGGGIYFTKAADTKYNSTIDLNGAIINNNTAKTSGGGIFVKRNQGDKYTGTINVNSGEMSGNKASQYGGGIFSDQVCIDFNGTSGQMLIQNNTAKNGGGIAVSGSSCTVNFTGSSKIQYNEAKNGGGGGIYVEESAKLNMTGGMITNNKATNSQGDLVKVGDTTYGSGTVYSGVGGGVYVKGGTFKLGNGAAQTGNIQVGLWGNLAYNAADDLYASGSGSKLDVPAANLMELSGYTGYLGETDTEKVKWIEDYFSGDTAYTSNWPGHSSNKGRFRLLDLGLNNSPNSMTNTNLNQSNAFVCATIGPVLWKLTYYNTDGTQVIKGPLMYNNTQLAPVGSYGGYSSWSTSPNEQGTVYNSGDTIKMVSNVNLYGITSPVGSLKITNTVTKAEGAMDPPADQVFNYTFTLPTGSYEYTLYNPDGTEKANGITQNGGKIGLKAGEYVVINGLPEGSSYKVVQDPVEDFETTPSSYTYQGTIVKADTKNADYTNKYLKTVFTKAAKIHKVNEFGTSLSGATFSLYYKNGEAWDKLIDKAATDSNGEIDAGTLESGKIYKLSENTPPEGYVSLTEDIYFIVTENGLVLTDNAGTALTAAHSFASIGGTDSNIVSVTNSAGTVLPNSGGIGTFPIYTLGLMLIVITVAAGIRLRRNRERRTGN